jgi:hypothetical protein
MDRLVDLVSCDRARRFGRCRDALGVRRGTEAFGRGAVRVLLPDVRRRRHGVSVRWRARYMLVRRCRIEPDHRTAAGLLV